MSEKTRHKPEIVCTLLYTGHMYKIHCTMFEIKLGSQIECGSGAAQYAKLHLTIELCPLSNL